MPSALFGKDFAERYELVREIGRGAMGVVYLAVDRLLERDVAIKMMLPTDGELDARQVERFLREARAVAKLQGAHVAHVYNWGTTEQQIPYIVMEHLNGEPLDELLLRRKKLPVVEAVNTILQACVGVSEAHARGIVHRDLKPGNMFNAVWRKGKPCLKVLDFGIAKLSFEALQLTSANQVLGSPLYMSPEQHRAADTVNHRTDLWSLGVILYQLVTGTVPFSARTAAELKELVLHATPVPPHVLDPQISPALSSIILRCLEKDPENRYADIGRLTWELAPFDEAAGEDLAEEVDEFLALEPPRPSRGSLLSQAAWTSPAEPRLPSWPTHATAESGAISNWSDEDTFIQAVANRSLDGRRVVFLVGSALTAPYHGRPGVPDATEMIRLVRTYYHGHKLEAFDRVLADAGKRRYQAAFARLVATHGMKEVNRAIRKAVLQARWSSPPADALAGDRETCIRLEADLDGWSLSPGVEALGRLLARTPSPLGDVVLTTNFDPLIEVAIARAGGRSNRVILHGDGTVRYPEGEGCQVVHLHGDWCRSDTLHTPAQLLQDRPKLAGSLARLLRERTLAVVGYGGWDDVFTRSLIEVVRSGDLVGTKEDGLDVLWAFYSPDPEHILRNYGELLDGLSEATARGRVVFYKGVNLHNVFPALINEFDLLAPIEPRGTPEETGRHESDRAAHWQEPDFAVATLISACSPAPARDVRDSGRSARDGDTDIDVEGDTVERR